MTAPGSHERPEADAPRRVFLTPGTLYCGSGEAIVTTVLGSCVAVCLMDRYNRAAGMNHFVLPSARSGEDSLRYGDTAMQRLLDRMITLGCHPADIAAKVFGGAIVLPSTDPSNTVGPRNVEAAIEWLGKRSIPVIARRTGGQNGLLIRMITSSSQVMVREVRSTVDMGFKVALPKHDSNLAFQFDAEL